MRHRLSLSIGTLFLASCSSITVSKPPRTATEELLISRAAEQASDQLKLDIPKGTKVFLDASNFEGTDSKYAVGTVRDHLLREGAYLVDNKAAATAVVEIRSGALSIDEKSFLIGVPGFPVPIPLAGSFNFPEIDLYKKETRTGVAKFAATEYDAKTGALVATTDPQFGFSEKSAKVILIFFSSGKNDTVPPGAPVDGAADPKSN